MTERFDPFEQRSYRLDLDTDPFGTTYAYDELGSLTWIGYTGRENLPPRHLRQPVRERIWRRRGGSPCRCHARWH
ncbi:MAG: hypothetical protein D6812_10440 [Deltaproteobacteria bacterium]|nr:MAG: hypothetical protein D6812_10440 [Deltaproteobacteria bacterium]